MLNKNQRLGKIGETAAYEYLQKENYIILEVNYRCKQGEIDIIAEDGEYLVFVEVKTRSSNFYGSPAEAVNFKKQQQICKAAHSYLTFNNKHDSNIRFDVVSIISSSAIETDITLIKDAFDFCLW